MMRNRVWNNYTLRLLLSQGLSLVLNWWLQLVVLLLNLWLNLLSFMLHLLLLDRKLDDFTSFWDWKNCSIL